MAILTLRDRPDLHSFVVALFFAASRVQSFATPQARRDFQARWLDYYLRHEPDNVLIAIDKDGTPTGYLTGAFNTAAAEKIYGPLDSSAAFGPHYPAYPAHLHINVDAAFRDRGVGAKLVEAWVDKCRRHGIPGVHLVTAADNRNVRFYERCGFKPVATHAVGQHSLVMLGMTLAP